MDIRTLITVNQDIQSGQPVFTGTRVPVESLFDHLEAGVSLDEFLEDFPTVSKSQAIAVLDAANRFLTSKNVEQLYTAVAMNYNGKIFRAITNTENGETSAETVFQYRQTGTLLTAVYSGGRIVAGHLLGLVDQAGNLAFRYHQLNTDGQLKTGTCQSTPEVVPNGKVRLHETWRWTSGDESAAVSRSGTSVLEEV